MEEEFKLSKEELESALWKKLEKHLVSQLSKARKINDHQMNYEDTNHHRGSIHAIKALIKLNPENEDI